MAKEHVCRTCGKHFSRPGSRPYLYCSYKCYFAGRWGPSRIVQLKCPVCGKLFGRTRGLRQKFCSRKCYWKSGSPKPGRRNRVERSCAWCGKVVVRAASNFHKGRAFCGHSCAAFWRSHFGPQGPQHPAWKGGILPKPYRTMWKRACKAVLSTAGETCQFCGNRRKRLLVHHKIEIQHFSDPYKANALSNLIAICHKCHRAIHSGKKTMPVDHSEIP